MGDAEVLDEPEAYGAHEDAFKYGGGEGSVEEGIFLGGAVEEDVDEVTADDYGHEGVERCGEGASDEGAEGAEKCENSGVGGVHV